MTPTAYVIYRGYIETHVRNVRDLAAIVPGCTFGNDTDPVLVSRHNTIDEAHDALARHQSDVRVYDAYAVRGYNVTVTEYWIAPMVTDEFDDEFYEEMADCTPFVDEIHIFGTDYTYDANYGWIEGAETLM